MKKNIWLMAVLLALALTAGCNLKVIQLNKRLDRWDKMLARGENPDKMYDFARKSIYFFLINPVFQRSKETVVTEQERLIFHRRMTSMQVFMIDYHARKALEAVDRPGPDWELGQTHWIKADSCTLGRVPGYRTDFSLVHVQAGYDKLTEDLVLHPEKYSQMVRDYPGLMAGLRKMSRFRFLEAEKYFAAGRYDLALDNYLKVFTRDMENFASADLQVRLLTGRGVKQTVGHRFMQERYRQTFENNRGEAHDMTMASISRVVEEKGQEAADSALYESAADIAKNFHITTEQNLDFYYYVQAFHNGNLPEYLRNWRHVVLEGQKPLRPQYSE